MAPVTRRRKKALAAAAARPPPPAIDSTDHLSKLPEEILAHILSFLPAQEAVQTCVLARTWRDVWKSTRRLHITGDSVQNVREFVDRLLRVRLDRLQLASLDATEIQFTTFENMDDLIDDPDDGDLNDEDMSSLNGWICRVLKCQIQMLRVTIEAEGHLNAYMQMRNRPLVSPHLTRLELTGVWFICRCLDLDVCPALEHLKIHGSYFDGVRKITSVSLKRLVITSCKSDEDEKRIWICAPRLVSLWLDDMMDLRTPLLERIPELVGAKVQIHSSLDNCHCKDHMACYHVMQADGISDSDDEEDYAGPNTTKCVVLEGLAQAQDLVLISNRSTFIFRRDLRLCPTFSKLKTLVLNHEYWCEPADCSGLACILEHAPLLEKLTLISDHVWWPARGKYKVEMKGHPDATEKSNKISHHLKIVEINCEDVNERFLSLLNFFGALNIRFQIDVTEK